MCLPLGFVLICKSVLENQIAKSMLLLQHWGVFGVIFIYFLKNWILFLCISQILKLSGSHHSHLQNSEYSKTSKQLHQHDKSVYLHSVIGVISILS